LVADDAHKGALAQGAKTFEDGVAGGDDAAAVFLADRDNPVVKSLVFNRFANGDAFHAGGAVEEEDFPIGLVAAKKDDALPFGVKGARHFGIFTGDDARKVLFSSEFGVFEAVDGEILERFFGVVDEFSMRKSQIIGKSEVAERPFAILAHEVVGDRAQKTTQAMDPGVRHEAAGEGECPNEIVGPFLFIHRSHP
jgi:hypothetical protein